MRVEKNRTGMAKGWYAGPWDSNLTVSVGGSRIGKDEPHFHRLMTEIYLIASGTATMRVEERTVLLEPGDVLIVEPGEAHTWLSASSDHFHFCIQTPGLVGDAARSDKVPVDRSRLGLE